MATGEQGALGLLCQYANANPEGIRLSLQQGEIVVFAGDGYEFRVSLTEGANPPPRIGSYASTGSQPTTSSGDPRTSSSGGSRPSGSWDLGEPAAEAPSADPRGADLGVPWINPVFWPPPPGWDPAAPWPPPPRPWAVYLHRRE